MDRARSRALTATARTPLHTPLVGWLFKSRRQRGGRCGAGLATLANTQLSERETLGRVRAIVGSAARRAARPLVTDRIGWASVIIVAEQRQVAERKTAVVLAAYVLDVSVEHASLRVSRVTPALTISQGPSAVRQERSEPAAPRVVPARSRPSRSQARRTQRAIPARSGTARRGARSVSGASMLSLAESWALSTTSVRASRAGAICCLEWIVAAHCAAIRAGRGGHRTRMRPPRRVDSSALTPATGLERWPV